MRINKLWTTAALTAMCGACTGLAYANLTTGDDPGNPSDTGAATVTAVPRHLVHRHHENTIIPTEGTTMTSILIDDFTTGPYTAAR